MAKKTLTKSESFSVIGQTRIRRSLARNLRADRVAHAYLFVGPAGVGKTAVALEFARLLLCSENGDKPCERCDDCRISRRLQHPDLRMVFPLPAAKKGTASEEEGDSSEALAEDIAAIISRLADDPYAATSVEARRSGGGTEPQIRIAEVRSILHSAMLKPYQATRKVFVIFHADTMNTSAQNAFLKVLEEPPEAAYFLLTAEREQALRPTVRSRCQRMLVPPLPPEDMANALQDAGLDSPAASVASALSGGSFTRARELAGGDVRTLQLRVIDFLKAAATCDPFKLPAASEALLNTESLPPNIAFDLLKMFFRDLAVRRAAGADETALTFHESAKTVDGVLSAFPQVDPDAAAQAVDDCVTHLARGYTESFALHALAIRLRECLGPRVSSPRSSARVTHASHN